MRALDISVILSPLRSDIKDRDVKVRVSNEVKEGLRDGPVTVVGVEVTNTNVTFIVGYELQIQIGQEGSDNLNVDSESFIKKDTTTFDKYLEQGLNPKS